MDTITGWRFNNAGDEEKLITISQWGSLDLTNESGAFFGCNKLTAITAIDIPKFLSNSGGAELLSLFFNCNNLTYITNLEQWTAPNINSRQNMFLNCNKLNQDISNLITGNVHTITNMLRNCTLFDQDLSGADFSSIIAATNFMEGTTTISTANYDALLISLDGQSLQSGVNIHFGNATYTGFSAAGTAHTKLRNQLSWTITDNGADIDADTVLWLDSYDSTTVTEASGLVSQWDDKSGLSYDVTQAVTAEKPLYTANSYMTFDGTDDELIKATTAFRYDEYTVLSVIRNSTTNTNSNVSYFSTPGGSNPAIWCIARSTGRVGVTVKLDTEAIQSTQENNDQDVDLLLSSYSGSSSDAQYIRINGTQKTGSVLASAIAKDSTEIAIGRQKSTRNFGGRIYEIIVLKKVLTSGELSFIESYLNDKWGVY